MNGLADDIKGAVALAHSLQLASDGGPATSIAVDRDTVAMANGYPTLAALPLVIEDTTGYTYDATRGVYNQDGRFHGGLLHGHLCGPGAQRRRTNRGSRNRRLLSVQ